MKIVLDTNVFVSGVFFGGLPYQILKAWSAGVVELVISDEILSEYKRVAEILAERYPPTNLHTFLSFVEQKAIFFDTPSFTQQVCEDPDDDKFLACALASGATIIVSGDKHLLKVSGYEGIQVKTPRNFVDEHFQ
ncbi:MAG: putative toxin-antitoxin system toxin component, PIN family [Anaerolineales bacterium]